MNDTAKLKLDTERIPVGNDTLKVAGKKPLTVRCSRKWIEKIRDLPDVREDLVAMIRARLANGFYESPKCLDIAIDRLLDNVD